MMYSLLIVEDDPEWRDVFSRLLDEADDIAVRHLAATAHDARRAIRRQAFDGALIDLGLPDGSGHDLVAEMAAAQPDADIAVCTVFEDENNVLDAIRAGARGYILKQDVAIDLLRLIGHMREGGAPISPRVARHILANIAVRPEEPSVRLTPRETEILELVASGMTLRKTASLLGIAPSTARSHIKNLYGKLGVTRRSAAILEATRLNIIR